VKASSSASGLNAKEETKRAKFLPMKFLLENRDERPNSINMRTGENYIIDIYKHKQPNVIMSENKQ
jgi:hypothetical protein